MPCTLLENGLDRIVSLQIPCLSSEGQSQEALNLRQICDGFIGNTGTDDAWNLERANPLPPPTLRFLTGENSQLLYVFKTGHFWELVEKECCYQATSGACGLQEHRYEPRGRDRDLTVSKLQAPNADLRQWQIRGTDFVVALAFWAVR